jgi:AmmeMemoRadiSam system protein B
MTARMPGRLPRRPAVAGTFYPAREEELSATVDMLLEAVGPVGQLRARAFVVPHAGYSCSGPTAAKAYARVVPSVRTVVLLGPSHYVAAAGLAVPETSTWATPLGQVSIDDELCQHLVHDGHAVREDRPHRFEHSLEVQLPFLQRVLDDGWSCVPITVGPGRAERVADCLDDLTAAAESLVLVSTDLSHYHDEATAHRLDRRTCQAVLDKDHSAIRYDDACGANALRGLLAWAARHDMTVELLDRTTSADTCADASRVVGYAAFAVAG